MRHRNLDRLMLAALTAAFGWCAWAFLHVARLVEDAGYHPRHVGIIERPTTTVEPIPPRVCIVDGQDTNWAARMGVPDQPRCA